MATQTILVVTNKLHNDIEVSVTPYSIFICNGKTDATHFWFELKKEDWFELRKFIDSKFKAPDEKK